MIHNVETVNDMSRWISALNVFSSALYVLNVIITIKMTDIFCNLDHQGWKSQKEKSLGFPVCFNCRHSQLK